MSWTIGEIVPELADLATRAVDEAPREPRARPVRRGDGVAGRTWDPRARFNPCRQCGKKRPSSAFRHVVDARGVYVWCCPACRVQITRTVLFETASLSPAQGERPGRTSDEEE